MSESVRETIDRVMQQGWYYDHPYQVGDRTFYVDGNSPFAQNRAGNNAGLNNMQRYNQETLNNSANVQTANQDYQLKPAHTYAWDVPDKYDHRDNLAGTWNNFKIINQEHPIEKPISTGSSTGDFVFSQVIKRIIPQLNLATKAYNYGYQGAGYYDNWHRAQEVQKLPELKYNTDSHK